ncbi:MAG TPA: TetR/AcrR family transcriptional regulator [Nocardioidaceae bacterium]|nr:TetR/AcrR family transcriptional regulator [Nocardioidaceae bacterium]
MTETTSRIDRRRERTRQRLVEAGRTLITEKGVAGLRIQEITAEADVALGSFYNYFPTKEDLVEAVVEESLAELGAESIVGDGSEDPAVTAAAAILRVVRLAFEAPDFARLLINLNHADVLFLRAFQPYARVVVERGIAQKRFSVPDIDVSVNFVVGASLALIRGILDGEHAEGAEISHTEVSLRALGVPNDEARRISQLPLSL